MKFTAVGDTAVQRIMPETYSGFEAVRDFIARGDARFFNLETTVNRDCFANMFSGGTWLRTDPKVLDSLACFGFNMTTFANNHCMDFSYDGLLQTIDNLNRCGYRHSGTGRNLSEAASPVYLDLPEGRVALISCTATCSPGAMAGEQSRRFPGRPGVNALNVKETVMVTEDELEFIKKLAHETGVNIDREASIRSGYRAREPEGTFDFKDMHFSIGEKHGITAEIDPRDLERIKSSIEDAAWQADYVLISMHSHDRMFENNDIPAPYIENFAHFCIDCGAHAVIGHGPHLLRPFEVYKNRPIFYSLGDFVLQLENCESAPEEFYAKFGLTSDSNLYTLFEKRTKGFKIGLQRIRVMTEAVIPYFEMADGELKAVEFMPIELGFGMKHSSIGLPRQAQDSAILERYAKMSEPYGTKFEICNGIAKVIL